MVRNKSRMLSDLSSSSDSKGSGQSRKKEKLGARGDAHDLGVKLASMGTPRRKGKCC